ncbi:ATP-binding protein, partial [Fulvivirga kasyanovii]
DINEIKIIKKDNQLLFTTSKGFYRFNEQTNRFEPDSSILKERININNIAEDKYGNYIISVIDENRKTHVEMLKKVGNEYVRDYIPFRRLPEMEITAIYPEGDYIWIAGGEGLFRFDRNVKKDYTIPFNTLVSQVSVRDSVIFYGNYYDPSDTTGVPPIILDQPEIFKPKLDFEDNSLTFNFSAAFYEAPERTLYSYYLENNEETWSKWSTTTTKEYNNLSAGTYTFHVKSKNIYDTEGRVASYEFTILPPWYQTGWAYFLFGVLALLFIWLIALLYTYRVRMQRRRLKLIVADRTYEVISQKKEIERQKDLLQLQFEKISKQKDSIEEKNSKLQFAQQETQTANEALQKLNTHLEKEVEKRTEKIKSTLHQLQLKNKELDTFIYRASHDLEGPISRISGLSALVKMAFPKDGNQEYLNLIEVTAKNMKVLISKLTQVHNLHNAVVKRELIDIRELLTLIIQSLQHLENGCSINYKFDIPVGTKIYGDTDLLTIILQNIIENALVFRKPRVEEHLIVISVNKTDDKAYIAVRDDGTGIHPDHIARVFDMFYRGTSQSLGSGLGLYLAKMAIDHMEGTIEVQSKLHEYTEFTVTIPQLSSDVGK